MPVYSLRTKTDIEGKCSCRERYIVQGKTDRKADRKIDTRPGTCQVSRGRLGRGSNAKSTQNSKIFPTDDRPTDRPARQGVESRVRDKK